MKSFLKLLAIGLVALSTTELAAQDRDFAAERLILDDGTPAGRLTISYAGPGPGSLIIPAGGGGLPQNGFAPDQTLRWDGSNWVASSVLLNDGTNITLPSGSLTLTSGTFTGNGAGLTTLNADNITFGDLDLARITTSGASTDQALMYNGANLVYGNPAASSLVLPIVQGATSASTLFSLTNAGTGATASFHINNAANPNSALNVSTNGSGNALTANSFGSGLAILGQVGPAGTGSTGGFTNLNPANPAPTLYAATMGVGSAGVFNQLGTGSAGAFTISNAANTAPALYATSNGTGAAVYASATDGPGVLGISTNDYGVYGTSSTSYAGYFELSGGLPQPAVVVMTDGGGASAAIYAQNTGSGFGIQGLGFLNDGVYGSSNSGVGVYGTSISGYGVHGELNSGPGIPAVYGENIGNGIGVLGEAVDGVAVQASNASNTAASMHALNTGADAAVYGEAASGVGGRFSGLVGVQIVSGSLVGSVTSINSGQAIPSNVATVFVNNDGTGANATATVPAGGAEGQIIIVGTDDANGLTIGTSSVGANKAITLVFLSGAWRTSP
jgi:hypothetical protein